MPRNGAKGIRDRPAQLVSITDLEPQPGGFHGFAGDVGAEQGTGQADTVRVNVHQGVAFDAFTAQHAVQVRNQQLDGADVGVLFKETPGFGRVGSYRHDFGSLV